MDFYAHYFSISDNFLKREFRNKIIEECKIQHSTYYSWLSRKKVPALAQQVISDLLQIPQLELFPEEKKEVEHEN